MTVLRILVTTVILALGGLADAAPRQHTSLLVSHSVFSFGRLRAQLRLSGLRKLVRQTRAPSAAEMLEREIDQLSSLVDRADRNRPITLISRTSGRYQQLEARDDRGNSIRVHVRPDLSTVVVSKDAQRHATVRARVDGHALARLAGRGDHAVRGVPVSALLEARYLAFDSSPSALGNGEVTLYGDTYRQLHHEGRPTRLPIRTVSEFLRLVRRGQDLHPIPLKNGFIDNGRGKNVRRSRNALDELEVAILSTRRPTESAGLISDLSKLEQTARAATTGNPVRVTRSASAKAQVVKVSPLYEGSRWAMTVFKEGSVLLERGQSGRKQSMVMRAKVSGPRLVAYLAGRPEHAKLPLSRLGEAKYVRFLSTGPKKQGMVTFYDAFDARIETDNRAVTFSVGSPGAFAQMVRALGVEAF